MAKVSSLCVYCGASGQVDNSHIEAAAELGRLAAERRVRIVFGGGRVGLMGVLADATLAAGGQVTGIIPEHLQVREVGHGGIGDLQVVDTMHSRKQRMCEVSDAFCVLPGGLGTLDEMFEIITWKQLGLHDKPVVLVNISGYWDSLLALIQHQAEAGYLRGDHLRLFQVVTRIDEIFGAVDAAPEPAIQGVSARI